MAAAVADLAGRCAVALYDDGGGRFRGSGFLVAPGQVLTCAHVLAKCDKGPITVRWAGGELTEKSRTPIPPDRGSGPTYATPDLGLISVDPPLDQPFVWLADRAPAMSSTVACLGFSEATPSPGAGPDSAILQVAAGSGDFIKVQQGEIPHGMSGSLALDLETYRVCGIVKASRDTQAPRGGWIIPVSVIAAYLGEMVEQNIAGHGPNSLWRQLATRHAEFTRRLFGSHAPMRVPDPPLDAPPSWWLDPRHRVTRFQERPELAALLAWAFAEDPATKVVRLVTGDGGAGKTRLAVELAAVLGARGWLAGVLTADDVGRLPAIADALPEIVAYGHKVFIALDYPEGMGDELARFLGRIPLPEEGTVRILLLARFGGAWWRSIHPSGEIKFLIDRDPLQLPPLGPDPDTAERLFSQAVQDYRHTILDMAPGSAAGAALPAALAEAARTYVSALKLHALALVSVLHEREHGVPPVGELTWADPLEMLVSHERKHWREVAGHSLSFTCEEPLEGRILLVPTLFPVYRAQDATAAISRILGLAGRHAGDPQAIASLLRDVYPPDGGSLRWWSPLPLDRLGETLLADVLADSANEDSAGEYVQALLAAADLRQAVQGLTLMARLSADPQSPGNSAARARRCLDLLATAGRFRLLPALLLADRQVAPGDRVSERHLANLDGGTTLALAQSLLREASGHRLLEEIGLVLLDHADRLLDTDEMRTAGLPEQFRGIVPEMRASGIELPVKRLVHVYAEGIRAQFLVKLGRAGEAIGPAQDAANAMREIFRASSAQGGGPRLLVGNKGLVFATHPSDQSEGLFHTLAIYAEALRAVGRLEESARARQEIAAVAAQLAEGGDPAAKQTAAIHLCEFAEILLDLGQADQAELQARDAVQLAQPLPDSLLTAKAMTLWARALDRAGRPADARAIAVEALRLHREVADQTGDRSALAVVAQALENLVPQSTVRLDPMAVLREEALGSPDAATPTLVAVANRRAWQLAGRGQLMEARLQMDEAVAQARRLAADEPDTYLQLVAAMLVQCAYLGLSADPAGAAAEAVGIFRHLVDQRGRSDLRIGLALSLGQHSFLLRSSGRDKDALDGFAESIEILRPLLTHDRWQTAMHLSTVLGLFSETARKHGDPEQAVAAAREAIDLEVARTDDLTPAPAERLAELRHMLFLALNKLLACRAHQGTEPAVAMAMAAEICMLARTFPASTLSIDDITIFAGALNAAAVLLCDSGQLVQSLPLLDEAAGLLRSHAAADSAGRNADSAGRNTGLLLRTGATRVHVYRALSRPSDAAHAMTGVLADCRRPLPGGQEERIKCLLLASDLIEHLPRPGFTAEGLRVATEMSCTCRELPADCGEGPAGAAASGLLIYEFLKEAVGSGLLGEEWKAAVLEISACMQFLADHAPGLFEIKHAEALAYGAGILAAASDLDRALDLNTRALEVYQDLSAKDDSHQRPPAVILVSQGLFLSGKHRYEEAVRPLEQALPTLLAAGKDISFEQAEILNMALNLLRNAYTLLKRDADMQAMMDACRAANLPDFVEGHAPVRTPGADLVAALQDAADEAAAHPERGVAPLQEVLDEAAKRKDYLVARAACECMITALEKTGRLPEALRAADLKIAYGHQAGLGPWTQLSDKAERLQLRVTAGADSRSILTEATGLITEVDETPEKSAAQENIDPDWVRESLLRSSASAAGRLLQWADALRFIQAEVKSLRERGAPPTEIADAEFNAFSALAAMNRITEATELLDRCETAFRQEHSSRDRDLGLICETRAELAARAGDLARAVALQSEALDWMYRSGEVAQIKQAHANFGLWLTEADPFSALALAHELATAVLAQLLGQTADIPAITSRMIARAGECPSTITQLCAVVDEGPGVHLADMLGQISRGTTASPGEILRRLLQQAREKGRPAFDECARHRMEWDPVFAGIIAARQGSVSAARAVAQRLSIYAGDPDWSQFAQALLHIFRQRPEAAAAISLDAIDRILLRRCMDALNGNVHIPPELAQAIPIAGELSRFLAAAQHNESTPVLARELEQLAGNKQWNQLLKPLQRILAGDHNSEMTTGLTPANAAIVSTLLLHLTLAQGSK